MKRLFIAMPVTLFDYQGLQDDFKDVIQGRWVPPENLHLTLQFLGDTYEKEPIIETLSALSFSPKSSELKGLALLERSNILYAKVYEDSLYTLNTQLRDILRLTDEDEFLPHVTLMRIKKVTAQRTLDTKILSYHTKLIGILHPKIQLVESIITSTGAHYTLLKEF